MAKFGWRNFVVSVPAARKVQVRFSPRHPIEGLLLSCRDADNVQVLQ